MAGEAVPAVPSGGACVCDLTEAETEADVARYYAAERDVRTRETVDVLLDRGRPTLARRVASCGFRRPSEGTSFPCERARLCWRCRKRKGGDAQKRFAPTIREWSDHWFTPLTLAEPVSHPAVARHNIIATFGSFRQTAAFRRECPALFGGPHVKPTDSGEYRAHLDVVTPVPIDGELAEAWGSSGGGRAETQRVGAEESPSYPVAVTKLTAYVVETTEDLPPEAAVNYALVSKGNHHWLRSGL